MASTHSKLPPSKAYQWSRCTASPGFIAAHPELPKGSSKYADEGTRAHAFLTAQLTGKPGQTADDAEMQAIIDELLLYIMSRTDPDDRLLVAQKVPLFYFPENPEEKGELDVSLVSKKRILILDLKYGVNTPYYAEENEQLATYAESQIRVLEQLEAFEPETPVELVIYQPRDRNDPTVVRPWHLTRQKLAQFCEHIQQAKDDIYAGRVKFMPGKACDFCPATGICVAYGSQGLSAISDEPVDAAIAAMPTDAHAPALTREQRQRVLVSKKAMIAWLEAVENQEVAELMAGAAPIQFKLVEGKSNRQWKDEKAAATFLAKKGVPIDGIYPPVPLEICSPAQGEKALKSAGVKLTDEMKAEIKQYTEKPVGKPSLVPVTDERPAMNFNPTQGLSDLVYEGI